MIYLCHMIMIYGMVSLAQQSLFIGKKEELLKIHLVV